MKRWPLLAFLSVLASLATEPVRGQSPFGSTRGIGQRPTVSPYLALRRGNPTLNYYNLIRPQVELQSSLQQVQQGLAASQGALTEIEASQGLPSTGHTSQFMTHSRFFMTSGSHSSLNRSQSPASATRAPSRATTRSPGR